VTEILNIANESDYDKRSETVWMKWRGWGECRLATRLPTTDLAVVSYGIVYFLLNITESYIATSMPQ